MNVLLWLIPVALFLGLLGLAAFLWALKSGQFDDLDGAAHRILFEDDDAPRPAAWRHAIANGRNSDGRFGDRGGPTVFLENNPVHSRFSFGQLYTQPHVGQAADQGRVGRISFGVIRRMCLGGIHPSEYA